MTGPEDEQKKRAAKPLLSFIEKPDPEKGPEGPRAPAKSAKSSRENEAERRREAHARRMAELERHVRETEAVEDDEPARKAEEARIREEMAAVEADLRARLAPGETRREQAIAAPAEHDEEPVRRRRAAPRREDYHQEDDHDDEWKPLVDPRIVLDAISRSRNLIIATTLLGIILGVAYGLSLPKMYASTADILVNPRSIQTVGIDLTPDQLPSDAALAVIESQSRLIDSASVLTKVIDQAGLMKDPEFNGSMKPGVIGGFIASLRQLLSGPGTEDETSLETKVLTNLRRSLTVSRDPKSFIVSVTVKTREPEKSAELANIITNVFQEQLGVLDSELAKRATGELSARLANLKANVEKADSAVQKFKAEHDLVDVQGRLITDDDVANLNSQLSAARAETIRLRARVESLNGTTADSLFTSGLPEGLNSGAITALRSQYAAARQQAEGLATKLGPRHPALIQAQSQAEGLRREVEAELRRIRNAMQVDLQRSQQQEKDLSARLAQLKVRYAGNNEDMVKLRELEREANAQRTVYEAFLLRTRETGEQQGFNTANVRVISGARPALEPLGPSRRTVLLAGLVLGLFAGLGIAILRGIYAALFGGGRNAAGYDDTPPPVHDAGSPSSDAGETRLAAAKRRARAKA
ncbi:GumC family protein [Brucella sp. IR073]|uniref:GumC family protein n=1 Tax=unclassified Brucella TaxID=2632610 RepID=UPI003B9860A4